MDLVLVTLSFSERLGELDPRPLEAAVRGREVLSVRDHFFVTRGVPHLALLMETRPTRLAEDRPPVTPEPKPARQETSREETRSRSAVARERAEERLQALLEPLSAAERELFEALRGLSTRVAQAEGMPRYAIFTNAELVSICQSRPESINALRRVCGIGRGKAALCGEQVLAEVACFTEGPREESRGRSAPRGEAKAEESAPEAEGGGDSEGRAGTESTAHDGQASSGCDERVEGGPRNVKVREENEA